MMDKIFSIMIVAFLATTTYAHIGPEQSKTKSEKEKYTLNFRAECQPGVMETDQSINNVRARLSTGGDVWWNRQEGLYVVPKPEEGQQPVSSIFAGGVWVGGTTRAGSLKLAGVTYRSLTDNFDWYPGPLDESGNTDDTICSKWDRFFRVLATDISRHNDGWENSTEYSPDSIPDDVKYWPGVGNPFWREKFDFDLPDQSLGAFWDEDGDGFYNPLNGDFPTIEIRGCDPTQIVDDRTPRQKAKELVPDEMIFWIYNDNGGPHRLSAGDAIQMEVQVQAFAYATNDEINDMTFQRYKLINRAQDDIIDCYFAMWVDPDLGCAFDDFSGCDNAPDASGKPRSLAFTYNEDAVDGNNGPNCSGGVGTYRFEVPIVGTDYFRGPRGPRVFARDDNNNIIIDTAGNKVLLEPAVGSGNVDTLVELGMTSCIFTFNAGSNPPNPATTDPQGEDIQFYNNMRGLWRTGEPVTFGGSGYNQGSTDTVRYMFSDPPNDPTGWSMCNTGVSNVDTRTLQATGPLLLQRGVINELIVGVVWVPDLEYPCPDLSRLQSADDLAQALFDNCFDITDGPDAPDISVVELDRELILTLSNKETSNNFQENYEEVDLLYQGEADGDDTYNFEGYKIFQLRDAGVSPQELDNIEKARLIYQVDVNNGVSELFNWRPQPNPLTGDRLWTFERMVQGADAGIKHTFRFLEDQFSNSSNRSLVNHKEYHFMVVAYGYNNWADFDNLTEIGQRSPYLEGRRNVRAYTFVPRPIVYENLNSAYGDGAIITRVEGRGNGGFFIELAEGEAETMLSPDFDGRVTYQEGAGPFTVKVFNPLEITDGRYRLEIRGEFDDKSSVCALKPGATWVLTDLDTNEEIASERSIDELNEQIIYKKGFSIELSQPVEPGQGGTDNGAVGARVTYKEDGNRWMLPFPTGGIPSVNEELLQLFINAGPGAVLEYNPTDVFNFYESNLRDDPDNNFNNLAGGIFIPYYSSRVTTTDAANNPVAPYISPGRREGNSLRLARSAGDIELSMVNNVDIVFTKNKDLWSRCMVVETANPYHYDIFGISTETGTEQMQVISKPSLDKNGNPDNSGTEGYSWFPGYAVDVETGQRLNIFFGENTIYHGDLADRLDNPGISTDMLFNPSSQFLSDGGDNLLAYSNLVLGGQHTVYVTRTVYDECAQLHKEFSKNNIGFSSSGAITWTGMIMSNAATPMLSVEDGLIPNDVTIKLRATNEFGNEVVYDQLNKLGSCNDIDQLPVYEFEFSGKASQMLEQDQYEGALANVNIVPNPYYAYSAYERSSLVNTVKITNLPDRAIVTIYTLDGKFIRQYNRDESPDLNSDPYASLKSGQTTPALEWDMKNNKGIPVASGVYLVHVLAPELNEERTLKWFGVNRKFDPTGL